MKVEVKFAWTDGTHDTRVHEAARVVVQTWKGGRARISRHDAAGVWTGWTFYSRYVSIDYIEVDQP